MQEDKEALFDSVDTVRAALEVFAAMLPEMKINRARMETAANDPNLLATDLAEYLVKKGMPFREAHETVGKLVVHAAKTKSSQSNSNRETEKALALVSTSMLRTFSMSAVHFRNGGRSARRAPRILRDRSSVGA